jgi:hypothetical protein
VNSAGQTQGLLEESFFITPRIATNCGNGSFDLLIRQEWGLGEDKALLAI